MRLLLGQDEAGTGAWAGPVTAGGVLVPPGWEGPLGLTDSKRLSQARRYKIAKAVLADSEVRSVVVSASADQVDELGVYDCALSLHRRIMAHFLSYEPHITEVVVDGSYPIERLLTGEDRRYWLRKVRTLVAADLKLAACSAASVLAKAHRDREMERIAGRVEGFNFLSHQGYGTPDHKKELGRWGPLPGVHRFSFAPIKKALR